MESRTIILKDIEHFDIKQTLESGQCFRFEKIDEKQYSGIAYNRVIKIGQINKDIYIDNSNQDDMRYIWINYFDLNRDYGKLKTELSEDKILRKAIEYAGGIHILKQQPFETLISYIISANNNIPRIKKIINTLCEQNGNLVEYNKKIYYTFPKASQLANTSLEKINLCRAGFRSKYIYKTSQMVNDSKYDFNQLKNMSYNEAKRDLKKFAGVGDKVADCILLFTGINTMSFPVDVWVKRVMEELYLEKETSQSDINKYGIDKFKQYAGFANTYLFYYIRNNK